jgi:aminomethyltransferase
MDETVSPLESGLAWTVAMGDDRDFIGKRALLEKPLARKLIGLVLVGKGVMRRSQKVRCAIGDGEITSGGFSPTLNRSIALARLPEQAVPGDMVDVEMRGNWLRARAVKPPFVRNGRILVEP